MIIKNIKVFTKGRNGYDAVGSYDGKGVTVKRGSVISKETVAKVNPIVSKLSVDKTIVSSDFVVLKDIKFRSPSTAATFVTGNISNGMRVWKVEDGKDLGKYREEING